MHYTCIRTTLYLANLHLDEQIGTIGTTITGRLNCTWIKEKGNDRTVFVIKNQLPDQSF